MNLYATETSNILDLMPSVVLFYLNTVRHVKCVRKMKWQDMWHAWGGGERCRLGLVEKLKGQRPYRTAAYGRDYNIKMDLKEIGW